MSMSAPGFYRSQFWAVEKLDTDGVTWITDLKFTSVVPAQSYLDLMQTQNPSDTWRLEYYAVPPGSPTPPAVVTQEKEEKEGDQDA